MNEQANLSEDYLAALMAQYAGTCLGRQELSGAAGEDEK